MYAETTGCSFLSNASGNVRLWSPTQLYIIDRRFPSVNGAHILLTMAHAAKCVSRMMVIMDGQCLFMRANMILSPDLYDNLGHLQKIKSAQ